MTDDNINDLRRQIQELHRQVNYWIASSKHWEKMCEQAHVRVMQLDPAFNRVFTTSPEKARALRDAVEPWQDGD